MIRLNLARTAQERWTGWFTLATEILDFAVQAGCPWCEGGSCSTDCLWPRTVRWAGRLTGQEAEVRALQGAWTADDQEPLFPEVA